MNSEPEPSQSDSPADSSAATTGVVDEGGAQDTPVETQAQPTETPVEVAEPPAEPVEIKAEPVEPNPYDQVDDSEPAPQDLNTLMQTDRGRQIYQSHKTLREFSKPLEEGGIGHIPSVEQIRDYYGAYRDRVLMDHDIQSGNPEQAGRLLAHLFNPQRGAGAQVIASEIGPALARLNPDAYAAAATPIITNYSSALIDRFQSETDPKMREALWYAANVASFDMTGEWLPQDSAQARPQQTQTDPLREQREQLNRQQAEINRAKADQHRSYQAAWQQGVTSKIATGLMGELDKALAPLKTLPPMIYESLRQKFHDQVVKHVPANRYAWDVFQARVKDARQTGNPESQAELASEYLRLATPAITSLRKEYLQAAGATVLKQSDARHAELRSIDQHKAATNGGAGTAPLNGSAPVKRLAGESQSDFNLRQLRS